MVFFATPAEEYGEIEFKNQLREQGKIRYGGGKCELIRTGAFDDIDLCLAHHIQPEMKFKSEAEQEMVVSKSNPLFRKSSSCSRST